MEEEGRPSEWTPEVSMTVKGVGAARVSPDGKRAAYTVTEPLMTDEKSELVSHIWLAEIDYPGPNGL